jgi:N-formylglutamate amidohydrolase
MNLLLGNKAHCFLAVLTGILFLGPALAMPAETLVLFQPGNLPILLTAPHGGQGAVPGVQGRSRGTTARDAGTLELAEAVAKRILEALGSRPYVVAAKFSRKYIDANRSEAEAFEAPEARPFYWAYHHRIGDSVSEIGEKFPEGGLLLDIHGQAEDPRMIHRGTRNGSTVENLIRRYGQAAVTGEDSILGYLQSKGYRVFPSSRQVGVPSEDKRFFGGYTVFTYGSNRPQGIDAIQVEIGKDIRADRAFADDLAKGIVVFYRAYLSLRAK